MVVIYSVNIIRGTTVKRADQFDAVHGATLSLSLLLLISQWFPYQVGDHGEEASSFFSTLLF